MVLLEAAHQAAGRAYVPYSNFPVGAALATGSDGVVTACNVENASYGLTICAERAVAFKAISEGEREFEALALCAPGGAMPCGACLQVLDEFNPGLLVLVGDEHRNLKGTYHLGDLLP
ncbi:MAG: cytidine deaminase, partial [Akkermansiaceae bacterium]|nr:cytidine deaminase [Akkermansiaceae bacterium]